VLHEDAETGEDFLTGKPTCGGDTSLWQACAEGTSRWYMHDIAPCSSQTNFMGLSPSREPANYVATQELLSILWNPKVHCHVQRILRWPLSWARSIQSISSHTITLRDIFILTIQLRLVLHSNLFPSVFPSNIYSPSPFELHDPPISFSLTWSLTWRSVQIMKPLIMQLSPLSRHIIPLLSKYPPQHPVLKHPQSIIIGFCVLLCSSLNVRAKLHAQIEPQIANRAFDSLRELNIC
jgi:hypothetical protein